MTAAAALPAGAGVSSTSWSAGNLDTAGDAASSGAAAAAASASVTTAEAGGGFCHGMRGEPSFESPAASSLLDTASGSAHDAYGSSAMAPPAAATGPGGEGPAGTTASAAPPPAAAAAGAPS